jgi:uncharacterized protein YabE (DUF348 family)
MLGALQGWFTALSFIGKVGVVTATAASAATVGNIVDIPTIETRTVTQSEVIPFETTFEDDPTLEIGKTTVKEAGKEGNKDVTYDITLSDGKETKREVTYTQVKTEPKNQISLKGVLEFSEDQKPEAILFGNTKTNDPALERGKSAIRTAGINGQKTVFYKITKISGKETKREVIREVAVVQPVNQVTAIGTKVNTPPPPNCHPSYKGACLPLNGPDVDCAGGSGNGPIRNSCGA